MSKQKFVDPMSLLGSGASSKPASQPIPSANVSSNASANSIDPMSLLGTSSTVENKPAPTPTPAPTLKKKEEEDTGLFGGIFSWDSDSEKPAKKPKQDDFINSLAFLDAASYGTGSKVSPKVLSQLAAKGTYTISEEEKAKRKELDDYFKSEALGKADKTTKLLASGIFRAGQAMDGIALFMSKAVEDAKALGAQSAMAVATGSLKPFELDTQEKVKEAQQTLAGGNRVQFLGELADSFGNMAGVLSRSAKRDMGFEEEDMDKGISDFVLEGSVGKAIGAAYAGVFENIPQMALLAATGGSAGAVFAGATSMGLGAAISDEYSQDKDVTYADAGIALAKGLVEGATETLFRTDIDAARSLGKSVFKLQPSAALESVKKLIKEEGEDGAKEAIIRDARTVMKKMLGGAFEEGSEEILATLGEFVIDTTRKGEWNEADYGRLTKQVIDSFVIGAASGGMMSGAAAAASYKPLEKEQQNKVDKYMEIANNEQLSQEVRDIAQKKADDIVKYNADKYFSEYTRVANLPIEERTKVVTILSQIKQLEQDKEQIKDVDAIADIDKAINEKTEKANEIIQEYTFNLAEEIAASPNALDGNIAFSPESNLTVTPDRGYVFHFNSKDEIPETLRGITPISEGELTTRDKSIYRISFTGQDLIAAGLATQAEEITPQQISEATADVDTTANAIQEILDKMPDSLPTVSTQFQEQEGKTVAQQIAEEYQKAKQNNTNPELVNEVENAIANSLTAPTMSAQPVVAPKPKRKRNVQTLRGMKPTEGVELTTNMVNDFTGVLGKLGRDTKQVLQNYVKALKSVRPEAKVFYYEDAVAMEKGLVNSGYSAAKAKSLAASSGGLFTTVNKGEEVVIHVNRQADLSKRGENAGRQSNIILAHEIVHATLVELARTNPSEFTAMRANLLKMLAKDEAANAEIAAFVERYSNRKEEVQAEEFLAQLGALITRQQATLQRSTLDKIKIAIRQFLQKVASKFKSKALMDLVESEVFAETAKIEDTARFLEGLGKSLREGTDINMKYINNLVKGSREYQQGLRYSVIENSAPIPSDVDANTLMDNDMVVEPEEVKQSMVEEGNWLDNPENKKRMTKYMSTIKGMTEDDIWLAKAIAYNENKKINLYTLKDKESVLAALDNQLLTIQRSLNNEVTGQFEFARDGELWENNGGYLFTGWKPEYIDNKIIFFKNELNANEILRWNKIKEDANYHKQEVGVIRDIQKNALLANIVEFSNHNEFDPAFSYMLINSMIYNKYQITNQETGEFKVFKYKQNQLSSTDASYATLQYDVVKALYNSENSKEAAADIGMAYQSAYMNMGKLNVVNSKFSKYIDKKSSTKEGYWLKFPKGNNPEVSYDLFEIAKTSHKYPAKWCTGNSDGMASSQLADGDFYIFVDNKTGDARIAVRYNGDKIGEVRGLGVGQAILTQDSGIVKEIVETFKDGKAYDSYSKTLNDIKSLSQNFFTKEESEEFLSEYNPRLSEERIGEYLKYVSENFSTEDILRIITEEDRSYGKSDFYLQNNQSQMKAVIQDIMETKGEPRNTVVIDYFADDNNFFESGTIKYVLGDLSVSGEHNFKELISVSGAIVIEGTAIEGISRKSKMIANKLIKVKEEIDIEYGDFEATSLKEIDNIVMRDRSSSINLPNTTDIRRATLRVNTNNINLNSLENVRNLNLKIEGINELLSLPNLQSATELILEPTGDENYNLINFNLNVPSLNRVSDYISLISGLSGDYSSINIFAPNYVNIREVLNNSRAQSLNLNIKSGYIDKVANKGNNSEININADESSSTSIGDVSVDAGEISLMNVDFVGQIYLRDNATLLLPTPVKDIKRMYLIENAKLLGERIDSIGELVISNSLAGENPSGVIPSISARYIEYVSIQADSSAEILNNDKIDYISASLNSYANLSSKIINRITGGTDSNIIANNLQESRIINLNNSSNFSAKELFRVAEQFSMLGYPSNLDTPKLFEVGEVLVEQGGLELNSLVVADSIKVNDGTFNAAVLNKVNNITATNTARISAKNLNPEYNLELVSTLAPAKLTITDSEGTRKEVQETTQEEPSDTKESKLGDIGQSSREEYNRRTKKTAGQKLANIYNKSFERNEEARLAFKKADMPFSIYSMYLKAGASPFAMRKFADAYFKIYDGLSEEQIRNLDSVIYLERVIAIDTNFDNRNKKRPAHPDIDQDNGTKKAVNKEVAENELGIYEQEFGKDYVDNLRARAKEYFNAFSEILKYKYDNGLISKETYDLYKDYNYSPRKFLEHIIDVNGISQNTFINRGLKLGAEEIKNIKNGSTDSMLFDSASLLKAAFISAENRVFTNRALKFIFEEGVTRNNDIVKDANYVKLKDRTIKLDKDGTPVVKEADTGYVNKTYRDNNGKAYTFQMKSDIAQQFDDLELSNSRSGIEKFFTFLLGANITRAMAVTLNPFFGLVNPIIDLGTQVMFSNTYKASGRGIIAQSIAATKEFVDITKTMIAIDASASKTGKKFGVTESVKQGEIRQLLEEYGTYGGFMTTQSEVGQNANAVAKFLSYYGNITEVSAKLSAYKFIKDSMLKDFASANVDPLTGEPIEPTQEQMRNIMISAAYHARETLDYNRGGSWSKTYAQYVPFFNVSMQVKKVGGQYVVNNPADFARKMADGIFVTAAITIANLLIGSDDYEKDPRIKIDRIDKTVILLPFTLKDLGLSDKEERAYIPLPTPSFAKQFFSVGQALGEQLYYDSIGKVNPSTGSPLAKVLERNYQMFAREISGVFMPKTIQAGISYFANYDFWTRSKLTKDDKMVESRQGAGNENILSSLKFIAEGIDKLTDKEGIGFGGGYSFSPEKLQKSLEVVTTSARYNPIMNTAYWMIDNMFQASHKILSGQDVEKRIQSKFTNESLFQMIGDTFGKGFGRLVKFSDPSKFDMPDFNAQEDLREEINLVDARIATQRGIIYNDLMKIYDESKEQKSSGEFIKKEVEAYRDKIKDPREYNYVNGLGQLLIDRTKVQLKTNVDKYYMISTEAKDPRAKAYAIWRGFGDIRGNEELLRDLKNIGIEQPVINQYNGILIERGLVDIDDERKPVYENWYKNMIKK